MRVWGLTGNIGSGKSTVARLLRARGVPVIDADEIAREVVKPGTPAHREIAERFPGVIGADGVLDRKALAARGFADTGDRAGAAPRGQPPPGLSARPPSSWRTACRTASTA